MRILNLTQHPASPEQREAGVYDLPETPQKWSEYTRDYLSGWLTFPHPYGPVREEESLPPTRDDVETHADVIAEMVLSIGHPNDMDFRVTHVMIGGAPFLMAPLEKALRERGITPLYAFSRRESVEELLPDGSVRKTPVFHPLGFVEGVF